MLRPTALRWLSVAMVGGGVAAIVAAALAGDAELHLVLVFPVVSGTGALFAAGALLFVGGVFLLFLSLAMGTVEAAGPAAGEARPPAGAPPSWADRSPDGTRWGGVVFLGPVPIVLGSNERMNRLMLVAAIVMAVLMVVFLLGLAL